MLAANKQHLSSDNKVSVSPEESGEPWLERETCKWKAIGLQGNEVCTYSGLLLLLSPSLPFF